MEKFESNTVLTRFVRDVMIDLIAKNDKALVANLLDQSKKVIVDSDTLENIIMLATDATNVEIESDVEKKTCNCCGKCRASVHLFATIVGITIDGKNINEFEGLSKYITDILNISIERIYMKHLIDVVPLTETGETIEIKEKEIKNTKEVKEVKFGFDADSDSICKSDCEEDEEKEDEN